VSNATAGATVLIVNGVNLGVLAGADAHNFALLYTPDPVAPGSTISHWDTADTPNQLMEPAINPDLTHSLIAPFDMTLAEMHDMGWFTDANLDGQEDATVILDGCDTRVANGFAGNGALVSDLARSWVLQCRQTTTPGKAFERCFDDLAKEAKHADVISGDQSAHLRQCAQTKGSS